MLKKSHRLQKRSIERLYKKGRSFPEDFIFVRFMPNRAQNTRFAVIVPKKVLNQATERNHWRRLVFTFLQRSLELWPKDNLDIALYFRQKPNEQLNQTLTKILKKLQNLK